MADKGSFHDLCVQFFDLLLVDFWGLLSATLERAGRAVQKRPFSAVDHRWVNANWRASSATVRSPFKASSATFALNSAEWF